MQMLLVVRLPSGHSWEATLSGTSLALGRNPESQLAFADQESDAVSWDHMRLEEDSGAVHAVDLDSTNGTFLNGKRLAAHDRYVVRVHDQIQFGQQGPVLTVKEISRSGNLPSPGDRLESANSSIFVGLDLTGWLIKASALRHPGGKTSPVALSPEKSFIPAAVELGQGFAKFVGWRKVSSRGSETTSAAGQWQGRAAGEDGGRHARADEVLREVVRFVSETLARARPPVDRIALVIPDGWPAPWQALTSSFSSAEWWPNICVRESAAVLAEVRPTSDEDVLLVHSEHERIFVSRCYVDDGEWKYRLLSFPSRPSLGAIRTLFINQLAEKVILATRRDPREELDSEQTLIASVEAALNCLRANQDAEITLNLFGSDLQVRITHADLYEWIASTGRRFTESVSQSLAKSARKVAQVIVWGDMVRLLPVEAWLASVEGIHEDMITVCSGDVAALGAARVAAEFEWQEDNSALRLSWLSKTEGTVRDQPALDRHLYVPVVEAVSAHGPAQQRLTLIDTKTGERKTATKESFMLGRAQQADWAFDGRDGATVSEEHALVLSDAGRFRLKDLGSTNGTFLNGERLLEVRELHVGDTISLGKQGPTLRIELAGMAET